MSEDTVSKFEKAISWLDNFWSLPVDTQRVGIERMIGLLKEAVKENPTGKIKTSMDTDPVKKETIDSIRDKLNFKYPKWATNEGDKEYASVVDDRLT